MQVETAAPCRRAVRRGVHGGLGSRYGGAAFSGHQFHLPLDPGAGDHQALRRFQCARGEGCYTSRSAFRAGVMAIFAGMHLVVLQLHLSLDPGPGDQEAVRRLQRARGGISNVLEGIKAFAATPESLSVNAPNGTVSFSYHWIVVMQSSNSAVSSTCST